MWTRQNHDRRMTQQNGLMGSECSIKKIIQESFIMALLIYVGFLGAMAVAAVALFFGLRAAKII
jgi:Cytochrome B6-F complex subunit VI (PetL)